MSFLKRLFGKKEAPVELPPEFLQENPPDWLIDMKGHGLPRGGPFSIRVQITTAARTGTADILLLPDAEGGEPKIASVNLERAELDRLLVILGFSFPTDILSVPSEVMDGCPAEVLIHRYEPYAVVKATCNLAGWLDSKRHPPPVVDIGKILLDVQRRELPWKAA